MVKSFRLSIVNRYNSQKGVRYVNKRLLDLLRKARSLKKSSFFISPKYFCLCLRVRCLIDGILLFCVHTHLAFFFYIVAYCLCSRCRCTIHSVRLPHVSACSSFGPSNDYNDDPFTCLSHSRHMPGPSFTSACTTKSEVMLFLKSSLQTDNLPHRTTSYIIRGR